MNKSNKITFLLTLLLVCLTQIVMAQAVKNLSLKNFTGIKVSSGIDLYLQQSTNEEVKLVTDRDLMEKVQIFIDGGDLIIKHKEKINWSQLFTSQSIKVYVNYKTLNRLSASGGSDVYTQNAIKTDQLNVQVSGGADIVLLLNCRDLQLSISGGADAKLKGSAANFKLSASGGSDTDAYGLQVNYANVNASGGSDVNLNVSKALEASATGGADINYKGAAILKKLNNSRSGDINHIR